MGARTRSTVARAGVRIVVLMDGMRPGRLATAAVALGTLLTLGCASYQPRAFRLDWQVSDAAARTARKIARAEKCLMTPPVNASR